jgi:hypothetical protein
MIIKARSFKLKSDRKESFPLLLYPILSSLPLLFPSDIIKYQENVAISPPSCTHTWWKEMEDIFDTQEAMMTMNPLNHKLCVEEPKFTAGRKNVIFVEFHLQALGNYKNIRETLKKWGGGEKVFSLKLMIRVP